MTQPHDIDTELLLELLASSARDASHLEAGLDPALAAELEALEALLTDALCSALEPTEPPTGARRALMDAVAQGPERLAPLLDRLAVLLDLGMEAARSRVAQIFDPASWEPFPVNGIALVHLQGGPATAGADVGFVRVPAGSQFPTHTHVGEERVLVLQGAFEDLDGSVYRAGDLAFAEAGSTHSFRALEGEDLIYAVVVFEVTFEFEVDLHREG